MRGEPFVIGTGAIVAGAAAGAVIGRDGAGLAIGALEGAGVAAETVPLQTALFAFPAFEQS